MFCEDMLQVSKTVVVVDDGLKLGGEKGSELVSSDSVFEVEIYDKLGVINTVYGIKDGNKQGPEGEWLRSTYRSGDRGIFGESALGLALDTTIGSEVGALRGTIDVF